MLKNAGRNDEAKSCQKQTKPTQQHFLGDILVTIFQFLSDKEIFYYEFMLVNRDWLSAVQDHINHNGLDFTFEHGWISCCDLLICRADGPPAEKEREQSLHRFIDRHYYNTHNTRVRIRISKWNSPWKRAVYGDANRIGGRVLAWKFRSLDLYSFRSFPTFLTPEAVQSKQITELRIVETDRCSFSFQPYLQYLPNLQTLEIVTDLIGGSLITALSTYGIRLSKLVIKSDYRISDDKVTQFLEYTAELNINGVVLKRHPNILSPKWFHCISSARLTDTYFMECCFTSIRTSFSQSHNRHNVPLLRAAPLPPLALQQLNNKQAQTRRSRHHPQHGFSVEGARAIIENTPKNRLSLELRVLDETLKAVLQREEIAEINAALKKREPTNSGQDTPNNEASSSAMRSHSQQNERYDETDDSVIDAAWRVWRNLLRGLSIDVLFDCNEAVVDCQASSIIEYIRLVVGIGVLLPSQHTGSFQASKLRDASRRSKMVLNCLQCLQCLPYARPQQNEVKVEGEVAVAEKDAEQQDIPFFQSFLDSVTSLVMSHENHVQLFNRYAHRLPQLNDFIIHKFKGDCMTRLQNDITLPSLCVWPYDLRNIVKYSYRRSNKINVRKLTLIVDVLTVPYLSAMIRCVQEFSLEELRIVWDDVSFYNSEWTTEEIELLKRFLEIATNNSKIRISVESFCLTEGGVSQQQSDNTQSVSAVNDISPVNGHRNPEDSLMRLDKRSTLLVIHDSAVCDALLRNASSYSSLTSLVIKSRSALPRGFLGSFSQLEHVQIDYSPNMLSQPQYLSATNEEHSRFQLQRLVIVFDDYEEDFDLTEPLICPIAVETLVLQYQIRAVKSVLVLLHLRQLIDAAHHVVIVDIDNDADTANDIRDMAALIYPTKEIEVEKIDAEIRQVQERMQKAKGDEE